MLDPLRFPTCFIAPARLDGPAALEDTPLAEILAELVDLFEASPAGFRPSMPGPTTPFAPPAATTPPSVASAPPVDPSLRAQLEAGRTAGPAPQKPLVGPHKVMAGDRRLIDASITDPVRVQRFKTDSRIVAEGQKYLGTPYVWGGDQKAAHGGVDCSGFTYRALKNAGCDVPLEWFRRQVDPRVNVRACETDGMKAVKDPRPGDVVVFGTAHVGIYVGNVEGVPMYMSANHGGRHSTRGNSGHGRVDVMPVASHPVQPPVYFRYTGR